LIALSTVAFVVQSQAPPAPAPLSAKDQFYNKLCVGKAYPAVGSTPAYTAYEPWEFIKGYALGTQSASTDTTSTCYGQVVQTYAFINQVVDGAYGAANDLLAGNLATINDNAQTLFQNFNNLVIQLSDQVIACQDSVKIKQLQTRTNKISGATNWAFTLAYGFFFDDIKSFISFLPVPPTNQKIRESGLAVFNIVKPFAQSPATTKIDCWELGKQLGIFVSETLEAKVDSYVALVEAQKLQ